MALRSTIFKVNLQISDMDRNYYAEHLLTLARHPSETDERMMVRLLAFALHADEQLCFTKGLCADDEPDLWQMTLMNEIELWIDVGLPDGSGLSLLRMLADATPRIEVMLGMSGDDHVGLALTPPKMKPT